MFKLLFRLVFLAVIVVGVIVLAFHFVGNTVLAKTIEDSVGAPVSIDKLHLGLLSSEIGIYGLRIENPDGFDEPLLATIPEIFVSYNLAGLLKKTIHIKEIRLNLDEITVERNASGQVNVRELSALKQSAEKAPAKKETDGATSQAPEGKAGLAVQIDKVDLSIGRARYVDASKEKPVIREFPLGIKNAQFYNLTDPKQVTEQVIIKTVQQIGLNALMPDLSALQTSFDVQAASAIDAAKDAVGKFASKFNLPLSKEAPATAQ